MESNIKGVEMGGRVCGGIPLAVTKMSETDGVKGEDRGTLSLLRLEGEEATAELLNTEETLVRASSMIEGENPRSLMNEDISDVRV